MNHRLYLSPPDCGDAEVAAVVRAVESGWVAPLGPEVDAFESEVAQFCDRRHAVAVSSGTAGLHVLLVALGIGEGDEVVVPTLTFGATAFAVRYVGATPIFLDVEPESWNLDPAALGTFLEERSAIGKMPAAVVAVDLFGRTCDYEKIIPLCERHGVQLLEDAAEALGATHGTARAGQFGRAAVFSFNGNKIITTSGGGMVVTDEPLIADRVRYLASQSREPVPWYEHREIGFNYRLSNILAALGRAQLERLPLMIQRRREIRDSYAAALGGLEGVTVINDPPWGVSNGWLTNVLLDGAIHPDGVDTVIRALEARNIESRAVWKPMHSQPVFLKAEASLTGVADRIFREGLCLPSGASMKDGDVERVTEIISEVFCS